MEPKVSEERHSALINIVINLLGSRDEQVQVKPCQALRCSDFRTRFFSIIYVCSPKKCWKIRRYNWQDNNSILEVTGVLRMNQQLQIMLICWQWSPIKSAQKQGLAFLAVTFNFLSRWTKLSVLSLTVLNESTINTFLG